MDFSKKLEMPRVLFGAGMLLAFIGFFLPMTKINVSYFSDKAEEYETIAARYEEEVKKATTDKEKYERALNGYQDFSGDEIPSLEAQQQQAIEDARVLRAKVSEAPTQADLDAKLSASKNEADNTPVSVEKATEYLTELTVRGNGLKNIDYSAPARETLDKAQATVIANSLEEEVREEVEEEVLSKESLEAAAVAKEALAAGFAREIKSNKDLVEQNEKVIKKNQAIADKYLAKAEKMNAKVEKVQEKLEAKAEKNEEKASAIETKTEEKNSARSDAADEKAAAVQEKIDAKIEKIIAAGDKKYDAKEAGVEAKCDKIMEKAQAKYEKAMEKTEAKAAKILEKAQAKHDKNVPIAEEKIKKYMEGPTAKMEAAKTESDAQTAAVIAEAEKILADAANKIKENPEAVTPLLIEEAKETAAKKIADVKASINTVLFEAEKAMAQANQSRNIEQSKLDKIVLDAKDEGDTLRRHTGRILEKAEAKCNKLRADLQDIKDSAELKAGFAQDKVDHITAKAEDKNDKASAKADAIASDLRDGAITATLGTAGVVLNKHGIAYLATFLWVVCLACLAGVVVYILTHRIVFDYLCWLIGCGFGIASIATLTAEFKLGLLTFAGIGSWIIFIGMTVALAGMVLTSIEKK